MVSRRQFRLQWAGQTYWPLQARHDRALGQSALSFIHIVNSAAMASTVNKTAARIAGVMHTPKGTEQGLVVEFLRVILHMHGFAVFCASRSPLPDRRDWLSRHPYSRK